MSLYDRHYMRYQMGVNRTDPLLWILVAMTVCYFAQVFCRLIFGVDAVTQFLSMSQAGLIHLHVWSVLTYTFAHGGPLHLIINLLIMYMVGKVVQTELGRSRFIWGCIWSALGGAVLFLVMHAGSMNTMLLGASSVVMGLLTLYCVMRPDEPITFLLFFVLPVTLRPRVLLIVLALVEAIMLTAELQGSGGVASSAHLGGMGAALLYYRKGIMGKSLFPRRRNPVHRKKSAQPPRFTINISSRRDMKSEVDRILDKINSEGFGSLTEEEKQTLDHARDILSR